MSIKLYATIGGGEMNKDHIYKHSNFSNGFKATSSLLEYYLKYIIIPPIYDIGVDNFYPATNIFRK